MCGVSCCILYLGYEPHFLAEGFIDMKRRRGGKGVPSGNLVSLLKFCDTSDNWPTNPKILGKESIVGHKRESKNRSLKFLILPLILSEENKYFLLYLNDVISLPELLIVSL